MNNRRERRHSERYRKSLSETCWDTWVEAHDPSTSLEKLERNYHYVINNCAHIIDSDKVMMRYKELKEISKNDRLSVSVLK